VLDWGGGLVWVLVEDAGDAGAGAIRAAVARLGGHATLVRGPAHLPALPPEEGAVAALTAGLRARFDPRRVFA
jgi:glycolate oxidase FAD binding subunit